MEHLIYQSQKKSCGYAAVKMALVHYGKNLDFVNLAEPAILKVSPSLLDLIDWAKQYGLGLKAYSLKDPYTLKDNKEYPLLAVLYEDGLSHMVYIKSHRFKRFVVFDPEKGKRLIDDNLMGKLFSGIYLTANNIDIKPYKKKKRRALNPLIPVLQAGFTVLSGLSLCAGFFYVDKEEGNFLFPVLLFSAFSLLQVASRVFTVTALKRFDAKFERRVDETPLSRREEVYGHYTRFKTAIFSGAPQLVGSALEIAAFSILFSLNEAWMGLGLLAIYLILLVERVLIHPHFLVKKEKIERMEKAFLGGPWPKEQERPKSRDLSNEAYDLASFLSYRRCLFAFLVMAVSLLLALVSGHVSLNFLLFSFMSYYFLGDEFANLLGCFEKRNEYLKEEAYFNFLFLEESS